MKQLNFFLTFLLLSITANANELPAVNLDLSPQSLYQNAQPIVQGIILLLLLCSVVTWTIAIFKFIQLNVNKINLAKSLKKLHTLHSFTQITQEKHSNSLTNKMLKETKEELDLSAPHFDHSLKQRIEQRLAQLIQLEINQKRTGIGLLATIGSVSPFIGLFGTVWGIMNSFVGIAQTKTTDLYAVAPGIAEALFATALGLVAAIPAVVLYNLFIKSLKNYQLQLNQLDHHILLVINRDLALNQLGQHNGI